ncbi:tryptophan--tRNA ligase [Metamycoplasma sualvi]|uniref:tryptophan--tRNA ligase n=1 Tax=Metamycoplasma sualvi TaxID=2125 RepID=UPI00387384B2
MLEKIVSGITATGKLTLGNYIGSIKNMIKLQNDYEQYIFVADLHALTTYIDPKELIENKKNIFALYLACGLDPQKTTLFFQSDVPAHSELNWIITTITNMGELSKMTQFKDKSQNIVKQDNKTEIIPTGLFVYPALMIADIILYNPKAVPVGIDQKQHLELCQKIVKRMNTKYHLNFNEPKPIIPKIGNKIKSLVNPEQKMSKSDKNANASIYLLDDPEVAYKKIQRAVTDSENKIYISEEKPGVLNLLTIFASLKDISIEEAEKHFSNKTYKDLKEEVGEVVKQFLIEIQKKYQSYIQNIDEIAQAGAKKANKIASENLLIIQKAFGLK